MESSGQPLHVQIKVDTGMGRVGCLAEEFGMLFAKTWENKRFQVTGVYTHFASADDNDLAKAKQQYNHFSDLLFRAGIQDLPIRKHMSNTAAVMRLPEAQFDMIRCGIGMYGYTTGTFCQTHDFKPIMKVEAPLIQIKKLSAGQSCGYGGTYVAPKDMLIGLIPFGYADGLFRSLSNQISLKVGDHETPVVGRISMDLTMIDLSNVPNPTEGMMVTVIDDQPGSCCDIYHMAQQIGTIPYEILISIGSRVKRVIVN
jgi:alanine racemase